jgi:hypothetical protein
MAGFDQRSRAAAGFHHPRVPQPFVETLALQSSPISQRRPAVPPALALILAVGGGQLLLERGELGEG